MLIPKLGNVVKLYREEGLSGIRRVLAIYMDYYGDLARFLPFGLGRFFRIKDSFKGCSFSVLTVLDKPSWQELTGMIESMRAQKYRRFEWIVVDPGGGRRVLRRSRFQRLRKENLRVRYIKAQPGTDRVSAMNRAAALASGKYLTVLSQGDLLQSSALGTAAREIRLSGADLLYSDEISFSFAGFLGRKEIRKGEYGPDDLRACDYIGKMVFFSEALCKKAGPVYRKGFEGALDYDLVLRLSERAEKVVHIGDCLCRSKKKSRTKRGERAQMRALASHLRRCGLGAQIEALPGKEGIFRVRYDFNPKGKLLILCRDEMGQAKEEPAFSTALDGLDLQTVFLSGRDWRAQHLHEVIEASDADLILLYDGRCVCLTEDPLRELAGQALREDVGVVGARALYQMGRIFHAGVALMPDHYLPLCFVYRDHPGEDYGAFGELGTVRNTEAVWDGCCMFRKSLFERLCGFDPALDQLFIYDFCLRAGKKGFWNVITPFVEIDADRVSGYVPSASEREMTAFNRKWDKRLRSWHMI